MHAVTALEPMPDLHDGERTIYNLWRVGGRIAVLDFIGVAPSVMCRMAVTDVQHRGVRRSDEAYWAAP